MASASCIRAWRSASLSPGVPVLCWLWRLLPALHCMGQQTECDSHLVREEHAAADEFGLCCHHQHAASACQVSTRYTCWQEPSSPHQRGWSCSSSGLPLALAVARWSFRSARYCIRIGLLPCTAQQCFEPLHLSSSVVQKSGALWDGFASAKGQLHQLLHGTGMHLQCWQAVRL